MNPHALRVLEFEAALAEVARSASSPAGAREVRGLQPSVDRDWIVRELGAVSEVAALLARDEGWSLPPIPEVDAPLARLRIEGSVLDASGVRDVGILLTSARTLRRSLAGVAAEAPALASLAERLVDLPAEEREIERCIDDDGTVRDTASPELNRLRREIRAVRGRLVERLTAFAASLRPEHQVSDASVTVREGRYVIPIRREARGEVGGIVHDESGTGATLFVEPPIALELMNRLREREAEEVREVLRILRALTDRLRPHHAGLRTSLETLVRVDSLYARGRYARRCGGRAPTMVDADTDAYEVVEGVHPLLLARGDSPVPYTLRMEAGERTLLVSGPNTGGKTVLLKAVGLLSLLAQSGVIPPVGEGSRLPVFREVFADIGDEQSIEASLSTFSAHVKNLREVLEHADHETLVLTDEIGSGTDPVEGSALAASILTELTRRSTFTVATTHLGELKLLATEDPAIVNASLHFDAERLEPTYRLQKGIPGRSYGLAIARRLGVDAAVLERAEGRLPEGERDVSRLLLALEAKEQRLDDDTVRVGREREELAALRAELDLRQEEIERNAEDAERRARQQARDLLLSAREQVETAIREVRQSAADGAIADDAARAARRRVEEAARRQKERTPERSAARRGSAPALEVGSRVRIASVGKTGTVVELRDGRALVEAGSLRMLLPKEDLTVLPPAEAGSSKKTSGYAAGYTSFGEAARPEVDLRGMRVDEMEIRLARAIDDAVLAGLPNVRVIHGKGTGALRERVQEILRADGRILTFRPGGHFEGGMGVTVVDLS